MQPCSDLSVGHPMQAACHLRGRAEQWRSYMQRILLTTATLGAFAFGAAGAMAQTAAPVPNASGSQTTNPSTYGATVPQNRKR